MAGFLRRVVRELRSAKTRIFSNPKSGFLYHLGGGGDALAGIKVDPASSMSLSAVFGCVQTIAYDVAELERLVYQLGPSGNKRLVGPHHHVSRVLRNPNPDMIEFDCWVAIMVGALLYGNGYAELVRNNYGEVKEILPIQSWRVTTYVDQDEHLTYSIDGQPIPASDIFHIKGLTADGLMGLLTTHMAKEVFGLALAANQWAAKFYANGARPGGHLKLPPGKVMPPKAKEELRSQYEANHMGAENAHRLAIFDDGLEYVAEGIDPEQSQLLQSRQFSVTEICRYFNINPIQIGENGRATWSNLEESNADYYGRTLNPWCRKIEQTISKKFFLPSEQGVCFVKHKRSLSGKILERYAAYQSAITAGWLLRSEAREEEGFDEIEGLDEPVIQGAMVSGTTPQLSEALLPKPNADPLIKALAEQKKPPSKPTPPSEPAAVAEDEEKKVRSLLACQTPLLVNEVRRLLRVEQDKVLRSIKRGDFSTWVSSFYPSHRGIVSSSFEPVLRAMSATIGAGDCQPLLANLVERHVQESRSDLTDEDGMVQRVEGWDLRADSFAASAVDELVSLWKGKVQ